MLEQCAIQQALFGYQGGHNLVASSTPLSPRARQFLANVTDGSGPESPEGFQTTITGLSLPETEYYALFCTWLAPEMPRPGCVWSHVLLIDLTTLAQIPDLSILQKYFLRPAIPVGVSDYEHPLSMSIVEASSAIGRGDDPSRTIFVISALYEQPEKGVVVLDENSEPWKSVIFDVWSQQWPRLRRNFAFSTGSLGDRRTSGIAFDLQIAPTNSQRLWGRGGMPTIMALYSAPPQTVIPWIRAVLDDICSTSLGKLRKFLFAYSDDVPASRGTFTRLVECFVGPDDDDPGAHLAQIANNFPQPDEAFILKRDQLTALSGATPSNMEYAWAATYFILKAKEAIAFNRVSITFESHAATFWKHKRADVLALIGNLEESERSARFLCALARALTPPDIPIIWGEQPAILPRVVKEQPKLATAASAWNMPEVGRRALWDSLRESTTDQQIWAFTCGAMLESKCTFHEQETVTLAEEYVTNGLLNWIKQENFQLPSSNWRDALRAPLSKAMQEGPLSPGLLALAVWTMPPERARSIAPDRPDVQALATAGITDVPAALLLPTYFWLTAVAFQSSGENSFSLLCSSIFAVYTAVERSNYPGEAWDILVQVLPEPKWGWDWDRCRRLRKALKRWIRENRGYTAAVRRAAPSMEFVNLIDHLS